MEKVSKRENNKKNYNAILEEPLISVIVPVYNVEKYLDKCVDSIVNQTYKNLEIILVDDGSPDNCPKMCDDWSEKDKRIKVIHKKNGGLSDARNKGIEMANGEYIGFVDSDDYVEGNYIEFLYKNIIDYDCEISMGKHYVIYPNKKINTGSGKEYIMNSKECLEKMLYGEDVDVSAWAKLYKKSLFKDISFPKGRLFEDSATTYKLVEKANSIVLDSQPIYYYIIRDNSITNYKFDEKKFDLIFSTEEMCKEIKISYPDLEKGCQRRMMYAYLSTFTQYIKANSKDKKVEKELITYIKKNKSIILKDRRIPKRDRASLYAITFGVSFFKFCWRIYSIFR